MASRKSSKSVEHFSHDEASRKHIPTAELEPLVRDEDKTPLQVAYELRNPDLDPQLVWRGKDLQTGQFSQGQRDQQFERRRRAQSRSARNTAGRDGRKPADAVSVL